MFQFTPFSPFFNISFLKAIPFAEMISLKIHPRCLLEDSLMDTVTSPPISSEKLYSIQAYPISYFPSCFGLLHFLESDLNTLSRPASCFWS